MNPSLRRKTWAAMPKGGYVPQRMCTLCRKRVDKDGLIRFVASEGRVVLDPTGRGNGRGAYICRSLSCMEGAKKRGALSKALKCEVSKEVWDQVTDLLQ